MTVNEVMLLYLLASVFFIQALKGLYSPATARRGNLLGIAGMTIAVLTTLVVIARAHLVAILIAMLIGGTIGAIVALATGPAQA